MKRVVLAAGVMGLAWAAQAASYVWTTAEGAAAVFRSNANWNPPQHATFSLQPVENLATTTIPEEASTVYLTKIRLFKRQSGNADVASVQVRKADGSIVATSTSVTTVGNIRILLSDQSSFYTRDVYDIVFSGDDALVKTETYSVYLFNGQGTEVANTSSQVWSDSSSYTPAWTVTVSDTPATSPVPEPTGGILALLGLGVLLLRRRRV